MKLRKKEPAKTKEQVRKKRMETRNQIMIGVLSVMIAIAGYVNFAKKDVFVVNDQVALEDQELEIDDMTAEEEESERQASAVTEAVATAKLNREQARAKSREILENIVANDGIEDDKKEEAVQTMVTLTGNIEKEASAEQLLGTKGFTDSVVSIGEDSVDVVVNAKSLTKTQKAQIEDIICRKVGVPLEKVVITTIRTGTED